MTKGNIEWLKDKDVSVYVVASMPGEIIRCRDCFYFDRTFLCCQEESWDLSKTEYPKVKPDGYCYHAVKLCEMVDSCEECPRYGDDCDGGLD